MGEGLAHEHQGLQRIAPLRGCQLPHVLDTMMRAHRRQENGGDHDHRTQNAEGQIAVRIGDAERVFRRRRKQEDQRQDVKSDPADIAEEETVTGNRGALVIIGGQLGRERGTGNFVECDEGPDSRGQHDEIDEETRALETFRRHPQEEEGQRGRNGRQIHQRVAAPPFGAQIVGNLPHDRIGEGIDDQGNHDGCGHQCRRGSHNEIVIVKKKDAEGQILDPIGHRAQAIEKFGVKLQRWRVRRRSRIGHVVSTSFAEERSRTAPSPESPSSPLSSSRRFSGVVYRNGPAPPRVVWYQSAPTCSARSRTVSVMSPYFSSAASFRFGME